MPAALPRALTSVADLTEAGLAAPEAAERLEEVAEVFRIRISPEMQAAIGPGAADPVARQFVPEAAELTIRPEERLDPIGDHAHEPVPGLTHRYPDRVILALTQTCEVYCRFCFRRETVGDAGALSEAELEAVYGYLAAHPEIREVILTGGDPLVLSPRRLRRVMERLAAIGSVDLVRFHSRIPVVAPQKISAELIAALKAGPVAWLVLHTNHAQELTQEARAALARLADAGVPLLSQSVLLRGINDSVAALEDLFRALLRARVKPYYLHHCDLARGTSHFRTTVAEGQALMAGLRGRISGTALPTYVLDIPGGYGKVPLTPAYIRPGAQPGDYHVTDPAGRVHAYSDPVRETAPAPQFPAARGE